MIEKLQNSDTKTSYFASENCMNSIKIPTARATGRCYATLQLHTYTVAGIFKIHPKIMMPFCLLNQPKSESSTKYKFFPISNQKNMIFLGI